MTELNSLEKEIIHAVRWQGTIFEDELDSKFFNDFKIDMEVKKEDIKYFVECKKEYQKAKDHLIKLNLMEKKAVKDKKYGICVIIKVNFKKWDEFEWNDFIIDIKDRSKGGPKIE